jgi:hypothetical protein
MGMGLVVKGRKRGRHRARVCIALHKEYTPTSGTAVVVIGVTKTRGRREKILHTFLLIVGRGEEDVGLGPSAHCSSVETRQQGIDASGAPNRSHWLPTRRGNDADKGVASRDPKLVVKRD